MLELRPYQTKCVNRVLSAYEEDGEDGYEIIVIPTGGGKTIIFSSVTHELQKAHGINVLIIAHREELLQQAADKYRMINPTAIIGKVGSGVHEYGGEVTVASIQTICRDKHIQKMQSIGYGLVIVDECHHVKSKSYQKVLEALPGAFVLGVTATPERLDKKDIFKGKKPLYQIDIQTLVKSGYLCNFRAIAIQTHVNIDSVGKSLGDFNEVELDHAVNVPERNRLIVHKYKEYTNGKRAACFCVSVDHAETLSEMFNEAGVSSAVIKGSTPTEERAQIYKDFHDGKVKVLCSVMVLTEGWDEPLVEVVIMARPTQSKGLYIQMFGRGLRLAPGKEECVLLDITDNCKKHKLQSLKKAVEKENMRNGESLLEVIEREEKEEKEIQVRKLREKRFQDKQIDLFEQKPLFEWKETPSGAYVIEAGDEKHRIALTPSKRNSELFYVAAKRAPLYEYEKWIDDPLPLEEAKAIAERKVNFLLENPEKAYTLDRNANWRKKPASESQLKLLSFSYGIPITPGLTSGQASDLIYTHKQKTDEKRMQKKTKKEAINV